jgi:hypothetical protein
MFSYFSVKNCGHILKGGLPLAAGVILYYSIRDTGNRTSKFYTNGSCTHGNLSDRLSEKLYTYNCNTTRDGFNNAADRQNLKLRK